MVTSQLKFNIFNVAKNGFKYNGQLNVQSFKRITNMEHVNAVNKADVNIIISPDRDGYLYCDAIIKCILDLQCRRCLDSVHLDLGFESQLAFSVSKFESELAEINGYDIVTSKNGNINLFELIEDEMILNICSFPQHEVNCTE